EVRDYDTDAFYGTLTDVLRTGANDVYEITRDGRQYLAPVIDEVVRAIDTENGVVRITPMKGIFDDAD
ncbi:MAG: 16S rRNA processing protein RimM, partial [Ruminococcus sp.]|nr:16S rRNA processing protein RimM [Ruminococcus sp.]